MIARLWRRLAPWATSTLVIVEVALVWSGWISLGTAIRAAVIIEILLWATAITRAIAAVRMFGQRRTAGVDRWRSVEDALAQMVPRKLARLMLIEPRLFACLLSWPRAHRSPRVDRSFRYDASLRPFLWFAFALVVSEGGVVDLVLAVAIPGSAWVWVVLGLHAYGAMWLLSFLASMVTRPHLLAERALILRDGIFAEIAVPYAAVLNIAAEHQSNFGRSGLKIAHAEQSALLAYGDANLMLTLDPTVPVHIDNGAAVPLRGLRFTADAPVELISTLRQRTSSATSPASR